MEDMTTESRYAELVVSFSVEYLDSLPEAPNNTILSGGFATDDVVYPVWMFHTKEFQDILDLARKDSGIDFTFNTKTVGWQYPIILPRSNDRVRAPGVAKDILNHVKSKMAMVFRASDGSYRAAKDFTKQQ